MFSLIVSLPLSERKELPMKKKMLSKADSNSNSIPSSRTKKKIKETPNFSGSHGTTPTHTQSRKKSKGEIPPDQNSFYITVKPKISNISKRTIFLIACGTIRRILEKGVRTEDYLILSDLYLRIKSESVWNIKDPLDSQVYMALKITLLSIQDLENGEKPEKEVLQFLSSLSCVPSARTYGSWKEKYNWERYFKVSTVVIELLLERSGNSIPYNSYCKGYGESSSRALKKQKTPFSSELDGEEIDLDAESAKIHLQNLEVFFTFEDLERKIRRKHKHKN